MMKTDHEQLHERVGELMRETAVPGACVGVLQNGETHVAGFGVTNVNHPLDVTADTLFQIGSISKTYTATLLLRLVELGKLDLDAPLLTYLPDFRVGDETVAGRVRVRDLLTHTAGWVGDHFVDTGSGGDANRNYATSMAGLPQLAPPGTHFSYNNASFSLAGHLIETVAEMSFEAAMQRYLFDPLGLTHSYFYAGDVMTHRFAVGHRVTANGAEVQRPWPLPRAVHPAGAICCSVGDLLRYAQFHLNDGALAATTTDVPTTDHQQLMSADIVRQMRTAQFAVGDMMEAIGLAWFLDRVDGVVMASHGGATVGQLSLLLLVPERQFALAIVTNADYGRVLTKELSGWMLGHYLGLHGAEPVPVEVPEEELRGLVGVYKRPFQDVELRWENGRLSLAVTFKQPFPTPDTPLPPPLPPAPLTPIAPDRFLVLEGPMKHQLASILRQPDGTIGWLRYGGRIHRK